MAIVRVSTKGQITIPKGIREELGLEPGTYAQLGEKGEGAVLTALGKDPVEAAYGMFAHLGPLTQDWLEYKLEERELEERKEAWLEKTLFRKSSSTPSR
ncbi:MAG: AbrB/MazE/SpoVT family DNA-binding domain-containing protein [Armatimonadetes bacterium]|nr:AbrB/MazE/SpoVT family DNA-binding domain-containing protein [Armatimonadota bacterium]